MKIIFKAFLKNLYGAAYGRVVRTFFIYLVVYCELQIADLKIPVAPHMLYWLVSIFTAGVMWQALSSETNAAHMQKIRMLPFEEWKVIFSYIVALGSYIFLTKSAALLTVLLAISKWSLAELLGSLFCVGNAILMALVFFPSKNIWFQEIKKGNPLKGMGIILYGVISFGI